MIKFYPQSTVKNAAASLIQCQITNANPLACRLALNAKAATEIVAALHARLTIASGFWQTI
jgi:hypothetical protein